MLAQPGIEDGLIDEELDGGALSYPVLGSHLSARADEAASGSLAGSAATPHDPAAMENLTVPIIGLAITFAGDADSTVQAIKSIGGDVRNVFDRYIEAFAPVTALADLGSRIRGACTELSPGHERRVAAHLVDA